MVHPSNNPPLTFLPSPSRSPSHPYLVLGCSIFHDPNDLVGSVSYALGLMWLEGGSCHLYSTSFSTSHSASAIVTMWPHGGGCVRHQHECVWLRKLFSTLFSPQSPMPTSLYDTPRSLNPCVQWKLEATKLVLAKQHWATLLVEQLLGLIQKRV
jgi:hypothetical protein